MAPKMASKRLPWHDLAPSSARLFCFFILFLSLSSAPFSPLLGKTNTPAATDLSGLGIGWHAGSCQPRGRTLASGIFFLALVVPRMP